MWGLWIAAITRNGAERQWFIVATISGNFFLLKSLLAGTMTLFHRYGPNDTYPCVFNMKRTTYPYLLADLYDAFQFEMINLAHVNIGFVPVETYSRNWIWPRSIFIIGRVWPWNWYCTHINLNNVILWGVIPICKIFAKTWHCLFCFGAHYSFWPFALTRECALHLRPCEKTHETYFAGGLAGFSKTICSVPE